MFHGISKEAPDNVNGISVNDFKKLTNDLFSMGFQAINMQQMADFMYSNAKISTALCFTDRR